MNIIEQAKKYAIDCHKNTNHQYDGKPYETHLQLVYDYALKYINFVDKEDLDDVLASCWTHDVIEDTRQTYNDVKEACNKEVAELTYALTNEKGKNRKERASITYYTGIQRIKNAAFVKICDRLANIYYSRLTNSNMLNVYKKEHEQFKYLIYNEKYDDMFKEMHTLIFGPTS